MSATTAAVPARLAEALAEIGRRFHARGWAPGTSGNYSAVSEREPLRLAITASGRDKALLTAGDVVVVDAEGQLVEGGPGQRPSAETAIHLAVVRARGAGAVLHSHSVWSTVVSDVQAAAGGIELSGWEVLAGLDRVTTHEHREWLPVVANTRDWSGKPADEIEALLRARPDLHGVLIRRHGLYTWGADLAGALRHAEILEFLLEVVGRTRTWRS